MKNKRQYFAKLFSVIVVMMLGGFGVPTSAVADILSSGGLTLNCSVFNQLYMTCKQTDSAGTVIQGSVTLPSFGPSVYFQQRTPVSLPKDVCAGDSNGIKYCYHLADAGTVITLTRISGSVIDTDGDGVIDRFDNCPIKANANQTDSDGDGKGDVCQADPVACLSGSYLNGGVCVAASAGYYVPAAGATAQTPCAVGYYQDLSGSTSCKISVAGGYVDTTGAADYTLCPGGTYQPQPGATSSSSCILTSPGHYAPSGSAAQSLCNAGTYAATSGRAYCSSASPGYFVNTQGATDQAACYSGTFTSVSGATGCQPAFPGTFVSGGGATYPTQCTAGTYQPNYGQASCISASAGYMVPAAGSSAKTACPVGQYQPATGKANCTPASAGYYVSATAATAQTPCAAGTYSAAGASSCYADADGDTVADTADNDDDNDDNDGIPDEQDADPANAGIGMSLDGVYKGSSIGESAEAQ